MLNVKRSSIVFDSLVLAIFFAALIGMALSPLHADAAEDPFHEILAGVEEFTLENGLRVLLFKRDSAPVFSAQIVVKVGGVNEEIGSTGIAHFLEHMAFKGTETIGTKNFEQEKRLLAEFEQIVQAGEREGKQQEALESPRIRELSAELEKLLVDNEFGKLYSIAGEVGLNAQTAKDYTAYNVSLPTDAFEFWCWLESDRLLNPVFRQFYKEREVVLEERRRNFDDSPQGKLYEKLLDVAYTKHPYKLPNIGYSADLKRQTATEMREFYDRYYRADNMVLAFVGNLTMEQMKPLVTRYFSRLPKREGSAPDVEVIEPEQTEARVGEIVFPAQPQVFIGYHKPSYPDPDDARLAILHSYLSEGRSSLLERVLVRERKVALQTFTTEAPGERFPSLFITGGIPAPGVSSERLRGEIQRLFNRFTAKQVSDADLNAAKRRVRVSFLSGLESDQGLALSLAKTELFYGDWRKISLFYRTMLETTAEDLERLVKKYLRESNSTFVSIRNSK